jgi:hypothetical protein
MAEEIKGILIDKFLVSLETMRTVLGNTSEYAGTNNTSSKVKPSPKNFWGNVC